VHVDPIRPTLNPPGTGPLTLKYDKLLSSFAFNFNLRRYIMDTYVSRYTLIIAGLSECVFIGHVYGADRLQAEAVAACGSGMGPLFPPVIKW